ncbi:MAG: 1-deoxy-D-xylulose-5-phosphate reductoisomerase [Oscillospiraceae bacterium]|jgi:1-deoxy-D-xylulose-5-phosphate reductoisomerase|nr:1-deoxy-D-xylulose-5-phosphate reductoisomerase [Oscillospiraceae bacterium]
MTKNLCILGSTGSIGINAIEIAKNLKINVCALAAKKNIASLEKQAREFKPKIVSVFEYDAALKLKKNLKDTFIKVVQGQEGLVDAINCDFSDTILNAIDGMSGLVPTFESIKAKKKLAIANKESIVAAGDLLFEAAKKNSVEILPIDSEHSAIFQCLQESKNKKIKKIILTASGGPFLGKNKNYLKNAKVEEALCHPKWKMGKKNSIDSASFMNKGLEIIEAVNLFGIPSDNVEVIIHKESVIHSMVEYNDNSVIAQLSSPDMKLPIQYALTWPNRLKSDVKRLNLFQIGSFTFQKPDEKTFFLLEICRKAIKIGGTAPAFLTSVDEKAVELFLNSKVSFLSMMELISEAFSKHKPRKINFLEDIVKIDEEAKNLVLEIFNKKTLSGSFA